MGCSFISFYPFITALKYSFNKNLCFANLTVDKSTFKAIPQNASYFDISLWNVVAQGGTTNCSVPKPPVNNHAFSAVNHL